MNRKDFLRGAGLVGLGFTVQGAKSIVSASEAGESCTLVPAETAGPFPLDLTANPFYFRQDVREDRLGVQLNQKLRIIDKDNCLPLQNARVNIWHCDKDGLYSGYDSEVGKTYLRGYQITDANGEVEFITILPGYYNGRVCHIHFCVYFSSTNSRVSQLCYPDTEKNNIYLANPGIYTKGADPLTPGTDFVFSDGHALQLATLTPNSATGGYDSFLEVAVNGAGAPSGIDAEPETGNQFKLGQNFPNPFAGTTTIPFTLRNPAEVTIGIWDLSGSKAATIRLGKLGTGDHQHVFNLSELGLPQATYAYQLRTENRYGVFVQAKVMTGLRP